MWCFSVAFIYHDGMNYKGGCDLGIFTFLEKLPPRITNILHGHQNWMEKHGKQHFSMFGKVSEHYIEYDMV